MFFSRLRNLLWLPALVFSCSRADDYSEVKTTVAPTTTGDTASIWGVNGSTWDRDRLPDFSFAGYKGGDAAIPDVAQAEAVSPVAGDDTANIQAAIDRTTTGAVVLAAGTYEINGYLKISKSGIVLRGAGDATVLKFSRHLDQVLNTNLRTFWMNGAGGLIWVGSRPGRVSSAMIGANPVTTVVAGAERGDKELKVASVAGIQAGDFVVLRVTDSPDKSFGRHLHAGLLEPGNADFQPMPFNWPVRVLSVSAADNKITLAQPLRFDAELRWSPKIYAYNPLQDIGIENLKMQAPDLLYAGHHHEPGFNGIYMEGTLNSWIRNVTFKNFDNSITLDRASKHNTLTGVVILARNEGRTSGHHGVTFNVGVHDNLLTDFDIQGLQMHDVTVNHQSSGNVVRHGKGKNLNFDHHRNQPFENLFSDINVGIGDRIYRSSGSLSAGPHAGARAVFWNVRSSSGAFPGLPSEPNDFTASEDFPRVVIVPSAVAGVTGHHWAESMASVSPADIYSAQFARRTGGGGGNQPVPPMPQVNLLDNGKFGKGSTSWTFEGDADGGAAMTVVNKEAVLSCGGSTSLMKLYQSGISLAAGQVYKLSFKAKASVGQTMHLRVGNDLAPGGNLGLTLQVNLTDALQDFTFEFTANADTTNARLAFVVPACAAGLVLGMDNVALTSVP